MKHLLTILAALTFCGCANKEVPNTEHSAEVEKKRLEAKRTASRAGWKDGCAAGKADKEEGRPRDEDHVMKMGEKIGKIEFPDYAGEYAFFYLCGYNTEWSREE
ncbi:hypothetical protein P4C99_22015 [Pontiellaceae bacterium B1224]|nr:hypothetical protein [Pontiellaceae bacterium B1224]